MKRMQVPVMVTVQIDDADVSGPDSAQVAESIHDVLFDVFAWDGLNVEVSEAFAVQSIDGIPADESDPDSPPVPAGQLSFDDVGQRILDGETVPCARCGEPAIGTLNNDVPVCELHARADAPGVNLLITDPEHGHKATSSRTGAWDADVNLDIIEQERE